MDGDSCLVFLAVRNSYMYIGPEGKKETIADGEASWTWVGKCGQMQKYRRAAFRNLLVHDRIHASFPSLCPVSRNFQSIKRPLKCMRIGEHAELLGPSPTASMEKDPANYGSYNRQLVMQSARL